MAWWSVFVETRGEDPPPVTDYALGDFAAALVAHGGVVTGGGGHPSWGARVSVDAATAIEAVAEAAALVVTAAAAAGLPAWPVVRAAAVREDVFDAELRSGTAQAGCGTGRHSHDG
jgi:hypothetical protein